MSIPDDRDARIVSDGPAPDLSGQAAAEYSRWAAGLDNDTADLAERIEAALDATRQRISRLEDRVTGQERAVNALTVTVGRLEAELRAVRWRLTDLEGGAR